MKMLFLLYFVLSVQAMSRNEDLSCETFNMSFERPEKPTFVLKHSCVTFLCQVPLSNLVIIRHEKDPYVLNSKLQRNESRFLYSSDSVNNFTIHKFTILNVMLNDSGQWFCLHMGTQQFFDIDVWYRPSDEEPLCVTHNRWPYYLVNDSLDLNCSQSHGEIEVELFLNVSESLNTSILNENPKEILLNAVLDERANGSYFNCFAVQESPKDLSLPSFYSSCMWGPVILFQNLSISLSFLNDSGHNGSSVSFVCICNVPDAFITLEFSPSLLNQSYLEPGRSTITVHIPKDISSSYLMIRCEATYRKKRVNASEIFIISKSKDYFPLLVTVSLFVLGTFVIIFIIVLLVSIFLTKCHKSKEIYRTRKPGAPPYTVVRPCRSHDSLKEGEMVLRRLSTTTKDSQSFPSTPPQRLSVSMTPTTSIKRNCSLPRAQYSRDLSLDNAALLDTDYNFIPADPLARLSVSGPPNSSITHTYLKEQRNNVDVLPSVVSFPTDGAFQGLEYDCIQVEPSPSKSLRGSLWGSMRKNRSTKKTKKGEVDHEMPAPGFSSTDDINPNETEYDCIPPSLPKRSSISTTPELSLKRNRSSRRRNDDKELVILAIKPPLGDKLTETEYDCIPAEDDLEANSSVVPERLIWEENETYFDNENRFASEKYSSEDFSPGSAEYDCIPSI